MIVIEEEVGKGVIRRFILMKRQRIKNRKPKEQMTNKEKGIIVKLNIYNYIKNIHRERKLTRQ